MAKVIIFGVKDFAELAHYYLTNDSDHEVVAFSVHRKYLPEEKKFHGLPIVAFENVKNVYPPSGFSFFAPMSPLKMNTIRAEVYHSIKEMGYQCISYISSRASVFHNPIGDNCFILEDNTIQPFTSIGNNVVLWSGNHIGHHGRIEDHVFFSSHVVLSGHCLVKSHCYFGVNSTIRDGITIEEGTLLAMGSTLTKSTEPWNVYMGSPAKPTGKNSKDAY